MPGNEKDEIKKAVQKQTAREAEQFGKQEEARPRFSPVDLAAALDAQMDGDARLLIELCRGKFVYDFSAGLWYRWNGFFWEEDILNEVMS